MRIIAVANQKGGCGKTTTVINLASSLAYFGKSALIIDMDPQGHASLGIGVKNEQVKGTIYDVLCPNSNVSIDDILINVKPSIDIVASNISLSALEHKLFGADRKEEKLIDAISCLNNVYDYILIDTPPSVGILTFNALRACREVFIPIDSSYFGLHGLGKLLETIILIKEKLKHNVRIKAIPTLVDRRTKVSNDVIHEIRKIFHDNTFDAEISLNAKLKEAVGCGKPVIEYDPSSVGAHDYLNLAKKIIDEENSYEVKQLMDVIKDISDKNKHIEQYSPRFVDGGILFTFRSPEAKSIKIAGDFNNWMPEDEFAFKRDEKGIWSKLIRLNPGLYQYKLIIDGKWISDPHNPIKVQSPFGGSNSVLVVK